MKARLPTLQEYAEIVKKNRSQIFDGNRKSRRTAMKKVRQQYKEFIRQQRAANE